MELHRKFLTACDPRRIKGITSNAYHIFADACFEPKNDSFFAGIGAVLCDADAAKIGYFSQLIPDEMLKALNQNRQWFSNVNFWRCFAR